MNKSIRVKVIFVLVFNSIFTTLRNSSKKEQDLSNYFTRKNDKYPYTIKLIMEMNRRKDWNRTDENWKAFLISGRCVSLYFGDLFCSRNVFRPWSEQQKILFLGEGLRLFICLLLRYKKLLKLVHCMLLIFYI